MFRVFLELTTSQIYSRMSMVSEEELITERSLVHELCVYSPWVSSEANFKRKHKFENTGLTNLGLQKYGKREDI